MTGNISFIHLAALIFALFAGWATWRAVIAAAILIRMHPKMRTAGNFARAFFSWRRS
jgi:hypothetical protein